MAIFITGATGYIGGSIAQKLIEEGYQVRGLVRDAEKAERLRNKGIEPVMGSLDDKELLILEAKNSDGVINAADSDNREAVESLLDGLYGSDKLFIHTSGSSVIGDDVGGNQLSERIFDQDTPFYVEPEKQARHEIDNFVLSAAQKGVRSVVICNSMIYGTGTGLNPDSVQIPPLVKEAKKDGVVHIVGKGVNRWSNVHIEDVATLYLLALKSAEAGKFYFAENGEASFADIGKAIAYRLNLQEVKSWSVEEATEVWGFAHAHYSFGSNSRVRAKRARAELGWSPKHSSVIDWIKQEMPV